MKSFLRRGRKRGPHVPAYPPSFPVPFRVRQPVKGGYLYAIYQGRVYGFGLIAHVLAHRGSRVGSHGQLVREGDRLVLDGPLARLPFDLPCRGFRRLRYTSKDLHRLSRRQALQEIDKMGLKPR